MQLPLLGRYWFCGVWVFQEVVASKNISIQCGHRRISWDEFCKILLLSRRYRDRCGRGLRWDDRLGTVRDLFHARCNYQEKHGLGNFRPPWHLYVDNNKGASCDILHNVQIGSWLLALNLRDKIYSMSEISTGLDLSNPLVAVNYSIPYLKVYTDYAPYILKSSNLYSLLSYVQVNKCRPFLSWVLD